MKSVESGANGVQYGANAFLGILSVSGIPEESRTRSLKLGWKSNRYFGN